MAAVGVAVRLVSAAAVPGLYKVIMGGGGQKRCITPEMPHLPGCQVYVEGRQALEGSWEHGRHIRSGTIRRA